MKDTFQGFYSPTQTELDSIWKDEHTIFIFDTNVFLNLYQYAEQTRNDFFKVLDNIQDRLWIPYHVGLEYQRRRLSVIRNEKSVFNSIEKALVNIEKPFTSEFQTLSLSKRFPKLSENTERLQKEIQKSISNYKKSVSHWDSKQPCVRAHDEIREKLDTYFVNKIGNKPNNQDWLDKLFDEGQERFKRKTPPGFKDAKKANNESEASFSYDGLSYERQYGDLIIWKQIIEHAKSENIQAVIFITDDSKEDWWFQLDSNGKKIIGPHAELRAEIFNESNIDVFDMYNTSDFLTNGQSHLQIDVQESSISDAKEHLFTNTTKMNNLLKTIDFEKYYVSTLPDWNEVLNDSKSKEFLNLFQNSEMNKTLKQYEDLKTLGILDNNKNLAIQEGLAAYLTKKPELSENLIQYERLQNEIEKLQIEINKKTKDDGNDDW